MPEATKRKIKRHRIRDHIDIRKVTGYAIAINTAQILFMVLLTGISIVTRGHAFVGRWELILLTGISVVVVSGAVLDIREAFSARKVGEEANMIQDAYDQLEELNLTLRAQRHDFMNHLQVVFGLLELGESEEAEAYIERIYGDIQRVSKSLKTSSPAINALLSSKLAECEEAHIEMEMDIQSDWVDLPMPPWEMCRVLGNLLDNAIDALEETDNAKICLTLAEDLNSFSFKVSNNGPEVAEHIVQNIFEGGVSTKGEGRGMGLAISHRLMQERSGQIGLFTQDGWTCFYGKLPKPLDASAAHIALPHMVFENKEN